MLRTSLTLLLGTIFALPTAAQVGTVGTIPGKVWDLSPRTAGGFWWCNDQGQVGRLDLNGTVTTLAGPADGLTTDFQPYSPGTNFPVLLAGVCEGPSGDVFVMGDDGHIWKLAGGVGPPVLHYQDVWMILGASDLIVDQDGDFLIASQTPSSGQRGMNWVSADGQRWAYYAVENQPVGLGADPATGNVYMSDRQGSGFLRLIDVGDPTHDTTIVNSSPFFFGVDSGDLAMESDGDAYAISGGTLWRFDRLAGTASVFSGVVGGMTALAIGPSSGGVPSSTGFSAYAAEGSNPATIREFPNVGAPASPVASDFGTPPGPGEYVTFFGPLTAMDLAIDRDGEVLVSGDRWGANFAVRRVDRETGTVSLIANEAQGMLGKVEGITVDQDGAIWCVTTNGDVQVVREDPVSVQTLFTDPANDVTQGKDIALARDGTVYLADRECFGCGEVRALDPATGQTWQVTDVVECKSVSADAFTGDLLVTEWNGTGFHGTINRCDVATGQMTTLPGFEHINYSNEAVRGDGDALMDVLGRVYTCSYDDWRVTRWDPTRSRYEIVGSMYLRVVTGLGITGSRSTTTSSTGWSLYVCDNDNLWEIPGVVPPAPQRVDPDAPGPGDLLGFLDGRRARPRAMIADPAGGGLLISTKGTELVRMDTTTGASTLVATAAQGLDGDLTALAARPDGKLYVGARDGRIWLVDPAAGYSATPFWDGSLLGDLRGLTVDGTGGVVVVDRIDADAHASRVLRIDGGTLQPLAFAARGARPAIDPLTAEVWVTQRGTPNEAGGELLRIDRSLPQVRVGNHPHDRYRTYGVGELDGGLAFASNGDAFVAAGRDGRVWHLDRTSGVPSTIAGNFDEPLAVVLASGRAGVAGTQGASAFVLDGWVVWESGVDVAPAGPAPATNPGLAPPADLVVAGLAGIGTSHAIEIRQPAEAGQLYVILPTFFGKEPGFPLFILEPGDDRVIANNIHPWWNLVASTGSFANFVSILDPFGENPVGTGLQLPPVTSILSAERFVDLAWASLQPGQPQPVDRVGGTALLYLGL